VKSSLRLVVLLRHLFPLGAPSHYRFRPRRHRQISPAHHPPDSPLPQLCPLYFVSLLSFPIYTFYSYSLAPLPPIDSIAADMVKNVRSSKSSPHLSLQDTTTATLLGYPYREVCTTLESEAGALSLQDEREVSCRAAESTQEALQNSGRGEALSSDQDGSDEQADYCDMEALRDYKRNGGNIHRIGKTTGPERHPRQPSPSAMSSMPVEFPSFPLDMMEVPHPELNVQWDDVHSKSLFEKFTEDYSRRPLLGVLNDEETRRIQIYQESQKLREELEAGILLVDQAERRKTEKKAFELFLLKSPKEYTQPFCEFLTENPTVFHAVDYFEKKLEKAGFKKVYLLCFHRFLGL
jgi:hypothetical protein